jgi:hypothetical protein
LTHCQHCAHDACILHFSGIRAMELHWKASFSASCLHAVACAEGGFPAIDSELGQLTEVHAAALIGALAEYQLPVQRTLQALASLASSYDNNRRLVELTLTRLCGPGTREQVISQLAAAIGTLETSLLAARPEMVDELALRGKPLVEQWSARGPGLLRQAERLTDENFVASSAEIVLVQPWVGGYGRTDLKTNRVLFEAVLTNPHADLPEALRLGWLLAQLSADLPSYSEVISNDNLERVAALATLPVILTAAETVEWGTCDLSTIERCLECWQIETEGPQKLAEQLLRWWSAYQGGSTSWAVAWRALEALLG